MRRLILLITFMTVARWLAGQWELPGKLVLDGSDDTQRQVTGLALPDQADHGVSVEADRNNAATYGSAQGTNSLTLALTPALSSYTPGLRVTFVPASVNTGDASLNINGLGAVPLRKNVNAPLDSADLEPGIPIQVIHDGAVFQVINQVYPACPAGYSPISRDVCIADASNDTLTWYGANVLCANRGARLCGFQEWIQGCLKYPAFVGSVSSYEWVDSAANYNNMAKNLGWNDTATAGDCRNGSRQIPTVKYRSRCCYDR